MGLVELDLPYDVHSSIVGGSLQPDSERCELPERAKGVDELWCSALSGPCWTRGMIAGGKCITTCQSLERVLGAEQARQCFACIQRVGVHMNNYMSTNIPMDDRVAPVLETRRLSCKKSALS